MGKLVNVIWEMRNFKVIFSINTHTHTRTHTHTHTHTQ